MTDRSFPVAFQLKSEQEIATLHGILDSAQHWINEFHEYVAPGAADGEYDPEYADELDRQSLLICRLRTLLPVPSVGLDPEAPGPTYAVWIAEPPQWQWVHDQDFTCSDDPQGKGARRSAHGYASYLRSTYPCSFVAVRPAQAMPLPVHPQEA